MKKPNLTPEQIRLRRAARKSGDLALWHIAASHQAASHPIAAVRDAIQAARHAFAAHPELRDEAHYEAIADERVKEAQARIDAGLPIGYMDPEPTAYEESLARRTGASVEQLRAEQEAALSVPTPVHPFVYDDEADDGSCADCDHPASHAIHDWLAVVPEPQPRRTFSELIDADATTTAEWLALPYRVRVTRFEPAVGRQILQECYGCSTFDEANDAMLRALDEYRDHPGVYQVTIEPPTAENGRLPSVEQRLVAAEEPEAIERWRDGWREQGASDREAGRPNRATGPFADLTGKPAIVPYAEGWEAREAAMTPEPEDDEKPEPETTPTPWDARFDHMLDLVGCEENAVQELSCALVALARLHQAEFAALLKKQEEDTASFG